MIHRARTMPFDDLWNGLQAAKSEGLVKENTRDGLSLFCYSEACVYDRQWNPTTLLARGIILDPAGKRVVATPFPKFFNVGEAMGTIPDLPFETFEKMDGSLIILFHHDGGWRCATKGSLWSDQAQWAMQWIAGQHLSMLEVGTTYLAEAIYPENRIVVHYQQTGLVMLAAYREDGTEIAYDDLADLSACLGWPIAERHAFGSISELLALAKELPASQEGFVLRFADGLRLKVKGDEYCRIHRLVSRLTPLAMWEAMAAGDNLEDVRRQLQEEFWADFDTIIAVLSKNVGDLVDSVRQEAEPVADLSDKEVGLRLDSFPEATRRFIFAYRKNGGDLLASPKTKSLVFRTVRPTGNQLPGYTPSYAIHRVLDEAV